MNARTPQRFLARGEYDQTSYDEAVITRAEKLTDTGAKFDPLEASNFDEALSETLCMLGNGLAAKMVAMLRSGEPVNKLLAEMTDKYWLDKAIDQAKDDMEEDRERAAEDATEDRRDQEREDRNYWLSH